MSTIKLENVGPIKGLEIEAPEDGGVIVLRGRNGSGKSQTIRAVDAALGRSAKDLTVHDGELKGSVEACGVKVNLARTNRKSGELVVDTLEGKLQVHEVVDPGLNDEGAADAKRIKALVSLVGADPDPALFYELLGGKDEFDGIVAPDRMSVDDLVVMAERIKRDCDQAARHVEGQADHAEANAHAAMQAIAEVDTDVPTNAEHLQAELESAIADKSRLEQQRADEQDSERKHQEAKRQLEQLPDTAAEVESLLSDVERLSEDADGISEQANAQRAAIEKANRELAETERELESANARMQAKVDQLEAAKKADALAASAREILGEPLTAEVTQERLEQAAANVTICREAIEVATLARRALEQKAEAEAHLARSQQLRKQAELLRQAGKGTDEVLSEVVSKASSALRVEGGRLVTQTKRGKTYYCDLSMGERWKIALDLAIDAVGEGGLFTIPQEAWEGLDPENRAAIAEHVKSRRVVVLTAEASDDGAVTPVAYEG